MQQSIIQMWLHYGKTQNIVRLFDTNLSRITQKLVFSKMGHSHYSSSARLMIAAEILETPQKVGSGVHHLHLCWLQWPPGQCSYHQEKWQQYHFPFNTQRYSQIQECQRRFFFSFKAYITKCAKYVANMQIVLRNSHIMWLLFYCCPRDIKTKRSRFVSICFAVTATKHQLYTNFMPNINRAIFEL